MSDEGSNIQPFKGRELGGMQPRSATSNLAEALPAADAAKAAREQTSDGVTPATDVVAPTVRQAPVKAPESAVVTAQVAPHFMIVGNRTGGQGKTLISQLLARSMKDVMVVAADKADKDEKSKIGHIIEDARKYDAPKASEGRPVLERRFAPVGVMELGAGPTAIEVLKDPHKSIAIWDKVGEAALSNNLVVDLGAQVVDSLLDWAENSGAPDLLYCSGPNDSPIPVTMVIPMMATGKAVTDAWEIYERLADAQRFPVPFVNSVLFVKNEADGSFGQMEHSSAMRSINTVLVDANPRIKASVATIKACASNLLRVAEANNSAIDTVCLMSPQEISNQFGLNMWDASRQRKLLTEWRKESLDALHSGLTVSAATGVRGG